MFVYFKLIIWKKLVRNKKKSIKSKSRLHCININADYCVYCKTLFNILRKFTRWISLDKWIGRETCWSAADHSFPEFDLFGRLHNIKRQGDGASYSSSRSATQEINKKRIMAEQHLLLKQLLCALVQGPVESRERNISIK